MAFKLGTALRVATINVRGLAAKKRQYQVSRLCTEHSLDVVAIQETKIESQEQTDRMVLPFKACYHVCVSHAVGTSGGCALFLKNSIGIVVENVISCASGRTIVCDFTISETKWRVICVYAPNAEYERKQFFQGLECYLDCPRMLVLLGDFNCVCRAEDRASKARVRDASSLLLSTMMQERNLEDAGCILQEQIRRSIHTFKASVTPD